MREIKFRAWDLKENKMIYGTALIENDGKWFMEIGKYIDVWHEVDFVTQYTGLKDINGEEIYESDILITKDIEGKKYQTCVTYENGMFLSGEEPLYDDVFLFEAEVVGNIYENTELLDDENKRNQ